MESAGDWEWVEMEVMADGAVAICYRDSLTAHIYVAHRDTSWLREDLGSWGEFVGRHLTQGPNQRPGVLLEADSMVTYATHDDSGWSFTTQLLPWPYPLLGAYPAFDTAGSLALAFLCRDEVGNLLGTACQQGDTWITDAIYRDDPIRNTFINFPTDFVYDGVSQFYLTWGLWHVSTSGRYQFFFVDIGQTGNWTQQRIGGSNTVGLALAPSPPGFAACYNDGPWDSVPRFYCGGSLIESLPADRARLRTDARGRIQMVYNLGRLKHAYRVGIWHIDTLPQTMNLPRFDFATDSNSTPLVAFVSPDGIFIARGEPLGLSEQGSDMPFSELAAPTIIRGVLWQGHSTQNTEHRALLDVSGRRVLELQPGANDVSRLAPGLYFLRSAMAVRKVVIQR